MTKSDIRQVSFELKLTDDELIQLSAAAGAVDETATSAFLSAAAKVSAEMFFAELLGRADYPTKVAARQTRLMKLVQYGFGNRMPSPKVVAALFHLTPAAATTLLNATTARFSVALHEARAGAVRAALQGELRVIEWGEEPDTNRYDFACSDRAVLATIREKLSEHSTLTPLKKDPDATNVYEINGESMAVLVNELKFEMAEALIPAADADKNTDADPVAKFAKQMAAYLAKQAAEEARSKPTSSNDKKHRWRQKNP